MNNYICKNCYGRGLTSDDQTCPVCKGTGQISSLLSAVFYNISNGKETINLYDFLSHFEELKEVFSEKTSYPWKTVDLSSKLSFTLPSPKSLESLEVINENCFSIIGNLVETIGENSFSSKCRLTVVTEENLSNLTNKQIFEKTNWLYYDIELIGGNNEI